MVELKHVGKITATGRKVLVAYRTLPGDSDYCLVVQTENLTDTQHDALIHLVESSAAQNAYEFAEAMMRSYFPDGSNMLVNLHANGKLLKIKTDQITMTPTFHASIALDELNRIIAEQRGVSINDLSLVSDRPEIEVQNVAQINETPVSTQAPVDQVLSDEQIAAKYRADADRLAAEADHYRKLAEELCPSKTMVVEEAVVKQVTKPAAKKPVAKKATTTAAKKPVAKKTTTAKKATSK